jgi:hypothetical protein
MKNMLKLTERVRCVQRTESINVFAKSWEEFKRIICETHEGLAIAFQHGKARVNPFSVYRRKYTFVKI